MHFPHIFLFTSVTSKRSIDINAISIFNNQPCMNHKDMKIIKTKLCVNNVACLANVYLANAHTIICKQCGMVHSLSSQCHINYDSILLY